MANYVSVDIDPSSYGGLQTILEISEVMVEEYQYGECFGYEGMTIKGIYWCI